MSLEVLDHLRKGGGKIGCVLDLAHSGLGELIKFSGILCVSKHFNY